MNFLAAFTFFGNLIPNGLRTWLTHLRQKKKQEFLFLQEAIAHYKKENETLRNQLKAFDFCMISSFHPEWKKNAKKQYVYVNQAFEFEFLVPIGLDFEKIVGLTDEQIFVQYPEFVKLMEEILEEAKSNPNRTAIRKNVVFPMASNKKKIWVVFSETVLNNKHYYLCRSYENYLFE